VYIAATGSAGNKTDAFFAAEPIHR
jgi:hypothetical protein